MYNISNYKNKLNEKSSAVVASDLKDRLKQYLDNEDFLEELSGFLINLEDGEATNSIELNLDTRSHGFLEDDILNIRVDKSDIKSPKFIMWIMNDAFAFADVDIDIAAAIFKHSTKGGLGTIGTGLNFLGSLVGLGDAGDDGTNEEELIGLAGAIGSIARDKHIDPKIYFDKLDLVYKQKYGKSITSELNTEFSGRAEAVALNTFRREIEPSIARGVNLPSILLDIALAAASFGTGTAAIAAVKGTSSATRIASAATKAGSVAKSTKVGSGIIKVGSKTLTGSKAVISRIPGFSKLTSTVQATHLEKVVKVGDVVKHRRSITVAGKKVMTTVDHTIVSIGKQGVVLKPPTGQIFNVTASNFLLTTTPELANNVLNVAKISATTAGLALATKKAVDLGDSAGDNNSPDSAGMVATAAEVMGWYDTLTSDPAKYIADIIDIDEEDKGTTLASMLMDLKDGTGFWGNTTDQEELAMALIITSISPEGADSINSEYSKLDIEMNVGSLLSDELGGDLGKFATYWWNAISGDTLNASATSIKTRLTTNNSKNK